jgi:hypothetical protein
MSDTFAWIVGTPIVVALTVLAVRRAIALKAAIKQHFEDEANGPKDPYAQMAAAMAVQQAIEDEKRRSRDAKSLLRVGKPPKSK